MFDVKIIFLLLYEAIMRCHIDGFLQDMSFFHANNIRSICCDDVGAADSDIRPA